MAWYVGILLTYRSLFLDAINAIQIVFIFGGLLHIVPFVYRMFLQTKRHFTTAADLSAYHAHKIATIPQQRLIVGPVIPAAQPIAPPPPPTTETTEDKIIDQTLAQADNPDPAAPAPAPAPGPAAPAPDPRFKSDWDTVRFCSKG